MAARTVLRWEAPPPDARGKVAGPGRTTRRDYRVIANRLRARAGEWAVIAEMPYVGGASLANRINRGASACWRPAGSYEATSRHIDGMTVVYARYRGQESSS